MERLARKRRFDGTYVAILWNRRESNEPECKWRRRVLTLRFLPGAETGLQGVP